MSEYTSYSTMAYLGEAGETVRGALHRRGIGIRDIQAWQSARERAASLQRGLADELAKVQGGVPVSQGETGREVSRAQAMLTAFQGIDLFKQAADGLETDEVRAITGELARLHAGLQGKDRHLAVQAQALQARIGSLATRVQEHLCQAEQEALLETTRTALSSLGYIVEQKGPCLRATRKQSCLWVQTNAWSELQMDFSGLSGLTCVHEMQAVESALARRGVVLERTGSNVHGRPEGGVLTQALLGHFPQFGVMETTAVPYPIKQRIKEGR